MKPLHVAADTRRNARARSFRSFEQLRELGFGIVARARRGRASLVAREPSETGSAQLRRQAAGRVRQVSQLGDDGSEERVEDG